MISTSRVGCFCSSIGVTDTCIKFRAMLLRYRPVSHCSIMFSFYGLEGLCGHTITYNNLSPFSYCHYSLCGAVPIASLCDVSHQSPPFIHKGRMWPEAAGVSEGWCNLSSWLDSTRMNSSLDRTGSVLTTVLRSCCLERNCFGLSLVACLYSSGLSCDVVHAAAGQMSTCIFVSVCEPIHHIFVSLLLIVPRDGLWSSAITPERLIPQAGSHLFNF